MENLVITQNFLNALNHSNSEKTYDMVDPPTQFSNGANVDGGRNLICIDPSTISGTLSDYTVQRTPNENTRRLLRLTDKGYICRQGGSRALVYDKSLTAITPSATLKDIQYACNFIFNSADYALTNPKACAMFGGGGGGSTGYNGTFHIGLIQGTENTWTRDSVDFTGKSLCVDRNDGHISVIPHDGSVCVKITLVNRSVSSFSQIDGLMLSITEGYDYFQDSFVPILAAANLNTAVSTSQGDTIQITLDLGASFTV